MDHKTINNKLRFVSRDKYLVSICGILLFAVSVIFFYHDGVPEYGDYQNEFRNLIGETLGPDRAASAPRGIQQIVVAGLGVTDRCITCHQGVEWTGLGRVPQPYKTHPREILEKHPISEFGCTTCHGGQGYATDLAGAHGNVEHWEEPLLGSELGKFYVINERTALMQMRCNSCHRYDKETKGASYINRAKQLVHEKGCRACHVINGRGGTVGPDLTYEGSKSPEQFNYDRIRGYHSAYSWHVAHLKNPKELVPESIMPNFNFSSQDAQALAMLVMSWMQPDIPVQYIPLHNFRDIPTAEEKEKEERMLKGPGAFFVKKNCFVCHSVSSLGIDAAAQIGPDLSLAVEDVQARFGRTLEDFLNRPTGTMEVVLSTMITLSDEERREVIERLRYAFELRKHQTPTTEKKY